MTKRELPDLSNATPDFLIEQIQQAREIQKEGKFFEGVYKEKLGTFREEGKRVIDAGEWLAEYVPVDQERIDSDAVKAAFSRDELIQRGFLKVLSFEQLRVTKKSG